MSHYTVLVVMLPETKNTEKEIKRLLAPYSEHLKVDPYEQPCFCIGGEAKRHSYEKGDAECGKGIQAFRDEYWALAQEERPDWETFIEPLVQVRKKYEESHPLYNKPNPECDDCGGSGVRETTYNPDSKWDWHVVGGRWKNMLLLKSGRSANVAKLSDIDWETRRKNKIAEAERCWQEAEGKDIGARYFEYGIERGESKEDYIAGNASFSTFAVLTSDGKWHERGKMGWWAVVSDEKETSAEWAKRFSERFFDDLDPESVLAVVDCHI